ncbi:hypothetical protein [Streptomyces sp. NRRL F-5053]|uniref:hypothetical protein n=1 Tax=Streptomyces sp. NRRL F-5053 TaxID=1463854 RepID=UPI0004C8FE23|nr:hypothetical protein [Streptomyces sp. NRRL F-5053]
MFRTRRTPAAVALVSAVLLLAAGCGDDGGSGDGGEDSPSPSKAAQSPDSSAPKGGPISENQADRALLAEENLPKGWSVADLDDTTAAGDSPDDLSTRDRDCKQMLDALVGDMDALESPTDASRSFQKSTKGPYLSQKIASFDGNGAQKTLSAFRKAAGKCKKLTTHNNQVSVEFTTSSRKAPKAGDDTAAVRARGTARGGPADGSTLTLDLVLTRVGNSTTGLAGLTAGGKEAKPTKVTDDVAKTAAARLKEAAKGGTPTPTAPADQDD